MFDTLAVAQSTDIAGVRTELASLETRLIRWMVGTVIATATLTVGILRGLDYGGVHRRRGLATGAVRRPSRSGQPWCMARRPSRGIRERCTK